MRNYDRWYKSANLQDVGFGDNTWNHDRLKYAARTKNSSIKIEWLWVILLVGLDPHIEFRESAFNNA